MTELPATLTMKDARAALAVLAPEVKQGTGALTIDAAALKSFDTAAIAALLELQRQAQAAGRTINVTGAPPAMIELAGLYGVGELLDFQAAQSARA